MTGVENRKPMQPCEEHANSTQERHGQVMNELSPGPSGIKLTALTAAPAYSTTLSGKPEIHNHLTADRTKRHNIGQARRVFIFDHFLKVSP